jgi:hypothetical protein
MKRHNAPAVELSALQRPDVIQLIQQILTLFQRNMARPQYPPRNPEYQNNNRPFQQRMVGGPQIPARSPQRPPPVNQQYSKPAPS